MPQYPTLRPSFSTKVDLVDDILANHVNALQDEVDMFADVIGYGTGANDPRIPASGGSGGTIHARLKYVESNKAASTHTHTSFGALTLGGATLVQFDGGTTFQGRRASDSAPWPLYFNWSAGGDIYLGGMTHVHDVSSDGTISTSLGLETWYVDWHAPGDFSDFSIRAIAVDVSNLHFQGGNVTNEGGYFDGQGPADGDWGTYPIRATNSYNGGNTGFAFYIPLAGVAAILKYYSGDAGYLWARASDDGSFIGMKASSFVTISSEAVKSSIEESPHGLDAVMALEPKRYSIRQPVSFDDHAERLYAEGQVCAEERDVRRVGLLAEHVHGIIPEVVSVVDGETQGIDYTALVPVLIKAIQEQQAQIQEQQSQIKIMMHRLGFD